MKKRNVLVTGGLGFMGSDMVNYLIEESLCDKLLILDNFSYAADVARIDGFEGHATLIRGDIRDSGVVDEAVSGVDIVLNFAAETHNDNSLSRPLDFVSSNVDGVANLLRSCAEQRVHFHQVSTDEVFGDLPLNSASRFSESSRLNPSSPYSASKAGAELLVMAWIRSFGTSATITNSANNFGSHQHSEKLIPQLFNRARAGLPARLYGSGRNRRDWLHVRDHSRAVWKVVSEDSKRTAYRYVVSANQVLSNLEVAAMVNKAHGLPEDFVVFVEDRPGHDEMYASSSDLLIRDFAWSPSGPRLDEWITSEARKLELK